MPGDLLLYAFYMCVLGAVLGCISGIIPGIHVNTLALLLSSFSSSLISIISSFSGLTFAPILLACCIVSAAVVHSMVDFVPSVFLGVPDPDSVMNVLPGHRLLLDGKGMVAVRCAAMGSMVGAVFSICVAVPMYYIMSSSFGDYMNSITVGFLFGVLFLMIWGNKTHIIYSIPLILLSGGLGLMVMIDLIPMTNVFGLEPEIMFPLLSGLFGIPALLMPADSSKIPDQTDDERVPINVIPGIKGALTGSITGWFPGVTSASGASLASSIFGEEDHKGFISMVSSIGTASTMFAFVVFAVSGKERSGIMAAVSSVTEGIACTPGSDLFLLVLFSMAISAVIGYFVTIWAGRAMCSIVENTNVSMLNRIIIIMMVLLTILFTGYWGLVVLLASTVLGMIPLITGCNRIHLTGCLIVPVILFKLGLF